MIKMLFTVGFLTSDLMLGWGIVSAQWLTTNC